MDAHSILQPDPSITNRFSSKFSLIYGSRHEEATQFKLVTQNGDDETTSNMQLHMYKISQVIRVICGRTVTGLANSGPWHKKARYTVHNIVSWYNPENG